MQIGLAITEIVGSLIGNRRCRRYSSVIYPLVKNPNVCSSLFFLAYLFVFGFLINIITRRHLPSQQKYWNNCIILIFYNSITKYYCLILCNLKFLVTFPVLRVFELKIFIECLPKSIKYHAKIDVNYKIYFLVLELLDVYLSNVNTKKVPIYSAIIG